jgi:hypothetical protein
VSVLSTPATLEYYDELARALPPPFSDEPDLRQRRLITAIEAFTALRPGDAYEARLAVQIVLCGAHAAECLFEASMYREDFTKRSRCRAQANSLLREERAATSILARERKLRLAEAAVAGSTPPQPATLSAPPPSAGLQAAPPCPAAPPATPQVAPAGSAWPPSSEAIARAEAFMEENELAAAQIRHDRGVTPRIQAYFHAVTLPTDPAVIDALVRGTSDPLMMLDETGGETLDQAA